MPSVGFEPTISAGERPLTYALHRAATGTGVTYITELNKAGKTERTQETQNCFKRECEDLCLLNKGHRSGRVLGKGGTAPLTLAHGSRWC